MKGENIGMKRNKRNNTLCWGVTKAFVLASMITACGVTADADEHSDQERIAALERKLAAFDEEVERLRFRDAFVPVSESAYALGPAASKVYFKEQGLSIGGMEKASIQYSMETIAILPISFGLFFILATNI